MIAESRFCRKFQRTEAEFVEKAGRQMNEKTVRAEIPYDPVYIPVDDDLYSTLTIGTEEFPFFLSLDNLSDYRDGFANWHNQKEVEIKATAAEKHAGSVAVSFL